MNVQGCLSMRFLAARNLLGVTTFPSFRCCLCAAGIPPVAGLTRAQEKMAGKRKQHPWHNDASCDVRIPRICRSIVCCPH